MVASSSSLSSASARRLDLAGEEQRGAEHEHDQPQHDGADPDGFPLPRAKNRLGRLSDHDIERTVAVAPDIEPRRRVDRALSGIGSAGLEIVRRSSFVTVARFLPMTFEVERLAHDDGAVAAQHGDGVVGREVEAVEQFVEIAEADRAHDDARESLRPRR